MTLRGALLFVLSAHVIAFAQDVRPIPDSLQAIDEEVGRIPDSDVRMLGKARALLGKALVSGDLPKAAQVLSYIDARFDSTRIITLQPRERMLAEFWVGRYERVLADPERAAELSWEPVIHDRRYRRPRLTPDRDLLLEDLLDHTRDRRTTMFARVQAARLGEEQREFLRLFVIVLVGPDPADPDGYKEYRGRMNDEADQFLSRYPRSRYEAFVRRYMRVVVKTSPWAYGLGVGMGGLQFDGELGRWFDSGLCFDLWGEVTYESWYLTLWATLGTLSEVRSTFVYNQTWLSGTSVSPSSVLLAAGYSFKVSRSIIVTPHAGWAYMNIAPPEQERTKTGFDGVMDFGAAVAGVNIDLPIFRSDDEELIEGRERGYQMLRARLAVMPTSTHIPFAKGTIVTFTLSYGLFGRPVERDL